MRQTAPVAQHTRQSALSPFAPQTVCLASEGQAARHRAACTTLSPQHGPNSHCSVQPGRTSALRPHRGATSAAAAARPPPRRDRTPTPRPCADTWLSRLRHLPKLPSADTSRASVLLPTADSFVGCSSPIPTRHSMAGEGAEAPSAPGGSGRQLVHAHTGPPETAPLPTTTPAASVEERAAGMKAAATVAAAAAAAEAKLEAVRLQAAAAERAGEGTPANAAGPCRAGQMTSVGWVLSQGALPGCGAAGSRSGRCSSSLCPPLSSRCCPSPTGTLSALIHGAALIAAAALLGGAICASADRVDVVVRPGWPRKKKKPLR